MQGIRTHFPLARGNLHRSKIVILATVLTLYITTLALLTSLYIFLPRTESTRETYASSSHLRIKPYLPQKVKGTQHVRIITATPTPTIAATPSPLPTLVPSPTTTRKPHSVEQIDDVTWRVSVEPDSIMATPQEVYSALNAYRKTRGVNPLTWDSGLANYAQGRAELFNSNGSLDSHAGFQDFMNNGGFEITGFNGLGENSAYMAGPMSGTTIIESLFSADAPHDNNQTDASWTHVGIGLSGNAVNVNFGRL